MNKNEKDSRCPQYVYNIFNLMIYIYGVEIAGSVAVHWYTELQVHSSETLGFGADLIITINVWSGPFNTFHLLSLKKKITGYFLS